MTKTKSRFVQGDQVVLASGTYKGAKGIVQDVDGNKVRLRQPNGNIINAKSHTLRYDDGVSDGLE